MEEKIKQLAREFTEEVISKYRLIANDPKSITGNNYLDYEIREDWEEYFEEKMLQLLNKE